MAFFQIITMVQIWKLCCQGKLNKVRMALARGEDVNSKSGSQKKTGLMCALTRTYISIDIVKLLLEQPTVDLNCTDINGWTALHYAAAYNNVEGVRKLLADPRVTTVNFESDSDRTPVMQAIFGECANALRELVAHPSVDLDALDGEGRSLEEFARWVQQFQILQTLNFLLLQE